MKPALLATTAVIALTAGAATGATMDPSVSGRGVAVHAMKLPPRMLFNQNSSSNGGGFDSQNFTSTSFASAYNTAGADDFVLPKTATMTAVDVSGFFFNGTGPASSACATLYTGGSAPKTAIAVNCSASGGPNFTIKIRHRLRAGKRYWISVVANCSYVDGCGEWAWETRSSANDRPAVWENPGNAFRTGCLTWKPLGDCSTSSLYENNDFLFDIRGK